MTTIRHLKFKMKNNDILKSIRKKYNLLPSGKKVNDKILFILEDKLEDILNNFRALISDVFKLNIDINNIKNITNSEERLEFISILQTFKLFKENDVYKYSIYDFIYVQKEIFCQISTIFISSECNWEKIKISESYNIDQDE